MKIKWDKVKWNSERVVRVGMCLITVTRLRYSDWMTLKGLTHHLGTTTQSSTAMRMQSPSSQVVPLMAANTTNSH